MNFLVIGSGAREHIIAEKLANSGSSVYSVLTNLNPGLLELSRATHSVGNYHSGESKKSILEFAQKNLIDCVVIGPEDPLVKGITDQFNAAGINCFGPSAEAAKLEGSKGYSKMFMQKYGIPTATFSTFDDIFEAQDYAKDKAYPLVIKADGLAAGKGVVIVENYESASKIITEFMNEKKFGEAGNKIVIEEFLKGQEVSFIVMLNGEEILPLATSQDHKTIGEGDKGLNTGGMGAYSPVPFVNEKLNKKIIDNVIRPTVKGLASEGIDFRGFLYAGLMIDENLEVKVLEYNCRFGDPETQPIMMRLESDLYDLIDSCFKGGLDKFPIEWNSDMALGVIMSSQGYPETYETGMEIKGLNSINNNIKVFHSGTRKEDNKTLTNGGRVLCVTALGEDIEKSRDTAYSATSKINWEGCYFRKDIGFRIMK